MTELDQRTAEHPLRLVCPNCTRIYDAGPGEPWQCSCGQALEFETQPIPIESPPTYGELDTREGIWAFSSFIPIPQHITLGEGFTPLVDAPAWDAQFKLEYVFPSGSFKDRGAATILSRAHEIGAEPILDDSSGNAGTAIAMYAARAGIDARLFVPADTKPAKLSAIKRAGATLTEVTGTRSEVTTRCIEAVESGDGWYASHAWNPAFYAGTQTFAFEIAAQRNWSVPDAVVLPIGHGTLFLGAYRGFRALQSAGWIDRLPRLLGVQAKGFAPIANELHEPSEETNRVADGIQIQEPARRDEILDAISVTGGDAISLGEDAVQTELHRLHQAGFYIEPTSAIAPAALKRYRERGILPDNDEVVIPLTGSGLKLQ